VPLSAIRRERPRSRTHAPEQVPRGPGTQPGGTAAASRPGCQTQATRLGRRRGAGLRTPTLEPQGRGAGQGRAGRSERGTALPGPAPPIGQPPTAQTPMEHPPRSFPGRQAPPGRVPQYVADGLGRAAQGGGLRDGTPQGPAPAPLAPGPEGLGRPLPKWAPLGTLGSLRGTAPTGRGRRSHQPAGPARREKDPGGPSPGPGICNEAGRCMPRRRGRSAA
jgi:hypothetical protein